MIKTIFFAIIATIGAFLYGYHTSIIAGAMVYLVPDLHLTLFQEQVVVSTVLLAGCAGAIFGGTLADFLGRKKTFFVLVILLFLGTFLLRQANGFTELVFGRLISGLGIGIVTILVPLYIAEISPPNIRGALVAMGQLMTAVGILCAYAVSYTFASQADWRGMFGFGFFPLLILFIGLFWLSETTSWLHRKEEKKERTAFSASLFKPVKIGLALSIFQQITGINTVIYYAPKILEMAGFLTHETTIFNTMLIGIVNALFAIIALFLIDRAGRKFLLITGITGMTVSLVALSVSISVSMNYLSLFALFFYVAFFAISLGPILGLILSEIFPQEIRGRAMGMAFFANWMSNYIVSLTFLTLVHTIGIVFTFFLFALICLIALWFVWKVVPETKGLSLEEIQKFWS